MGVQNPFVISVTAGAGLINSGSALRPIIDVVALDTSIVVALNTIAVGAVLPTATTFSAAGTALTVTNNLAVGGVVSHAAGLVGTPSITFTGDLDTGIYHSAANTIDLAAGGAQIISGTVATTFILNNLDAAGNINMSGAGTLTTGNINMNGSMTAVGSIAANGGILRSGVAAALAIGVGLGTENAVTIGTAAVPVNLNGDVTSATIVSHAVGLVGTPSITFTGDVDTGFWHPAANIVAISTNGAELVRWTASQVLSNTLGAAGTPVWSFVADPDTGIFSSGANVLDISAGGTSRGNMSTTAWTTTVPDLGPAGAVGAPAFSFSGDPDTGMYNSGANNLAFVTQGTSRLNISTTGIGPTIQISQILGNAGAPGYSFSGDLNTGMFSSGADTIDLSTGGTSRFTLTTTSLTTTLVNLGPAGAVGAPTWSFSGDPDTGMFNSAANNLQLVTNGVARITFTTTAMSPTVFVRGPDGALATCTYAFTNSISTGVYSPGVNIGALVGNGVERMRFGATGISFFAAAEVAQQTVAALTNNVTAGGVNDTIANYTDLVIYANDAGAIRNDIYQLARSVQQHATAIRNLGLGA